MKHRALALTLAAALAASPAPSDAIAPALLFMVKQAVQQAATSMIKDALLSSLGGMGCKGIALSNALSALDLRRAGGGSPTGLIGSLAQMPPGMAMPNLPNLPNLPMGMPGAVMGPGGMLPGAALPPEMAAQMAALIPSGALPPGLAIDPTMMARVQQMLSQPPLSPPETLATIDELFELGFMPKAIQSEFKECMLLVPATIPALGMAMGLIKPMIPQLRQAREQLHALSPAEQDEVAHELTQQLKALPADQRSALIEYLDSGFFPARVAQGAKAGLAAAAR